MAAGVISLAGMPDTSMFHFVTADSCLIKHGEQIIEAKAGGFIFIPKGLGHIVRRYRKIKPKTYSHFPGNIDHSLISSLLVPLIRTCSNTGTLSSP